MAKNDVTVITGLLNRTHTAHTLFQKEVLNGVYDAEWPRWYAWWVLDHGLNLLLSQPIDGERLTALFANSNEQHKLTDKRQTWEEFTAVQLAEPSLPPLTNWDATAHSLHKAAQVLGVIRMIRLPHVPNYLEMALKVRQQGLSTDTLPAGFEVILDFQRASLVVYGGGKELASIALAGQSQTSLLKALLMALKDGELASILKGVAEDALVDKFLAAASAAGHDLSSAENQITGNDPLVVEKQQAQDYVQALYAVFTGVARFRAHLNGPQSPVAVWPGHFDLSTLWFATDQALESAAHMNFGFAPFGGGIDTPYLYAYAYPMPKAQDNGSPVLPTLPAPAYWNTSGWTGVVVRYTDIAKAGDPEGYVEQLCEGIFRALRPLLG